MKNLISTLALVLMTNSAEAALQPIVTVTNLRGTQNSLAQICYSQERRFDCSVKAFKLNPRSVPRTWEFRLEQTLRTPSMHSFLVTEVPRVRSELVPSLIDVAQAAGVRREALTQFLPWRVAERVTTAEVFASPSIRIFRGFMAGRLGLEHEFVALVDEATSEVLVFEGGFSERL